ncbi:MAG: PAS domain S-box protein [Sedimentisphaerales bacterium]|nr:PAS domain S-box protein [Sedimentisphaerales bacterium]
MLDTVKVPKPFEPLFLAAQEYVRTYFHERSENPSKGTIEIAGQRYILVRGASLSVDLFGLMMERYQDVGSQEAVNVARSFLFDIAHTIGKMDARSFHKKMGVKDPIERLSAGPVHFAHMGWAFVDISAESKPSPDEDFLLLYDHPFSFESDAWIRAGAKPDFPVCVMNAGYSSGWCEESFGIPLLATEITCKARGDEACRFIMAHPSKIEQAVQDYLRREPGIAQRVTKYQIPDLSKRKRAEETLLTAQEENRKLAAVASRTRSSVAIMTADGRIDWVNDGFVELNDYTFDQVRGQDWLEFLFSGRTDPEVVEWTQAHIQDKQGGRTEARRCTCSGKHLWLDMEIQPILNDAGALTSIVVIETDITERKEAQERQALLLEQIEKANKELTDFAYIVSHDLKAPLRAIKNLVTWLSEDCRDTLSADNREQMDLLTGRVDRMQMLIEGVLQYSRAGRSREEAVRIDLNQLLEEVIEMLAPPQNITTSTKADLPVIHAERTRIQQVFQNLLSNAIKFMDKLEGRITVDFVEQDDVWQFSVTDNGPGIDEKHFDLVFEMFKTLQPRDEFESTGVGLTVVKKVVEHYGGKVWLESKLGEGTTFFFTLAKHALAAEIPEPVAATA